MDGSAPEKTDSSVARRRSAHNFHLEMARPEDDDQLRRMLRDQPMTGRIHLTMEREPCMRHAADVEGDSHHTVVLRNTDAGRIIGMASRSVRTVFVNGKTRRLGYLSQLRRSDGRFAHFHFFASALRHLHDLRGDELPYDLCCILADNKQAQRAARLLARAPTGMPAMVAYEPIVTLIMPTTQRLWHGDESIQTARDEDLPAIAGWLERCNAACQFAPRWTAAELACPQRTRGLSSGDFLVIRDCSEAVGGCAAIWDQQAYKQIVVRGYPKMIARLRPVLNLGRRIMRQPALPAPGTGLRLAYLSHLGVRLEDHETLVLLIRAAVRRARERGLDYLAMGLAARHPSLDALRRQFAAEQLTSMLYMIHWPDTQNPRTTLDDRIPHVELALL